MRGLEGGWGRKAYETDAIDLWRGLLLFRFLALVRDDLKLLYLMETSR